MIFVLFVTTFGNILVIMLRCAMGMPKRCGRSIRENCGPLFAYLCVVHEVNS